MKLPKSPTFTTVNELFKKIFYGLISLCAQPIPCNFNIPDTIWDAIFILFYKVKEFYYFVKTYYKF